jgi:hypothetical protein
MHGLDYSAIRSHLVAGVPSLADFVRYQLPRQLSAMWVKAYLEAFPEAEIVSIRLETLDYLFDLTAERNIAAYTVTIGRNTAARDRARMAGHPKAEGKQYHRGHMIPHSGHGGTDINLFSQLGSVNTGQFRELEERAVANPGSFYFVRLLYPHDSRLQRPAFVEQGLLSNTSVCAFDVRVFPN